MKLCACCSAPAHNEAPTCSNCGEASWLDAGSEPPPALELAETVEQPAPKKRGR